MHPEEGVAVEVPAVGGSVHTDAGIISNPIGVRPVLAVPVVAAYGAYNLWLIPVVVRLTGLFPAAVALSDFTSITKAKEGSYGNGVCKVIPYQAFATMPVNAKPLA